MRRASIVVSLIAVVLIAVLAAGRPTPGTGAQDGTPSSTAGHPAVGAWVWDTDAADPANRRSYGVFHADGTYVEVHPLVGVGIGAWRATGERTVDLTIFFQDLDPTETGVAPGTLTIRAAVEADETAGALTAPYTSEGRTPDGAVLFTGAFVATATRLKVEPMAPVGSPVAATPSV